MEKAGDRIKLVRGMIGLNQAEFAALFGFKGHKIRDIESGKQKVTPEFAKEIERKLSYNFEWILTGNGRPMFDEGLVSELAREEDYSKVIVHELAGPENLYQLFRTDSQVEVITLSDRYIDETSPVKFRGNSMEPCILDGAILGVDYDDLRLVSGNLYAFWLPHEGAVIKRVFLQLDKAILKSDNSAYPPIEVPLNLLDDSKINKLVMGRVKWVLQML